MPFALPPLYPILDEHYFPEQPRERAAFLTQTACELADAGVTLLQLRMKSATREQVVRDATTVREAAGDSMCLILNDCAELVREIGFNGVHLGQEDLALEKARALLGLRMVIGFSTHSQQQAAAGDSSSADYLAAGPVFATGSKADAAAPIGVAGVRAARQSTGKPLVAIGGITLTQAQAVWDAGADSVAVIGALWGAEASKRGSPGRLAGDFLRLFR